MLVAFWGMESRFGRIQGSTPVFQALATLAWEPRRATYFRSELFDALTMVQRGHIEADTMTGSWAGAMGQTQFMPSSYLKFAVDFDGDERRDIWKSTPDTLASMANYLKGFGWKSDETWGREVTVSAAAQRGDRRSIPKRTEGCYAQRNMTERRPLAMWQKLGVRRVDGGPLPKANMQAGLVDVGERKFLVYPNYEAIIAYNCAHYYALTVGLLADRLTVDRRLSLRGHAYAKRALMTPRDRFAREIERTRRSRHSALRFDRHRDRHRTGDINRRAEDRHAAAAFVGSDKTRAHRRSTGDEPHLINLSSRQRRQIVRREHHAALPAPQRAARGLRRGGRALQIDACQIGRGEHRHCRLRLECDAARIDHRAIGSGQTHLRHLEPCFEALDARAQVHRIQTGRGRQRTHARVRQPIAPSPIARARARSSCARDRAVVARTDGEQHAIAQRGARRHLWNGLRQTCGHASERAHLRRARSHSARWDSNARRSSGSSAPSTYAGARTTISSCMPLMRLPP